VAWVSEITLKGSYQAEFYAASTENPQVLWLPKMVPGESYCCNGQPCLKIVLFRSRISFVSKTYKSISCIL